MPFSARHRRTRRDALDSQLSLAAACTSTASPGCTGAIRRSRYSAVRPRSSVAPPRLRRSAQATAPRARRERCAPPDRPLAENTRPIGPRIGTSPSPGVGTATSMNSSVSASPFLRICIATECIRFLGGRCLYESNPVWRVQAEANGGASVFTAACNFFAGLRPKWVSGVAHGIPSHALSPRRWRAPPALGVDIAERHEPIHVDPRKGRTCHADS